MFSLSTEAPKIFLAISYLRCSLTYQQYFPMIEIIVGPNLEKAMRVLKRKLIREGVFKELKARRFYEKPSEKKKRKEKEAHKKRRKEQERSRRFNP